MSVHACSAGETYSHIYHVLEALCGFAMRSYGQTCRSKIVAANEDSVITECCYQLYKNLDIDHPVGQLVLEAAETFHDQYGCSTRTLLCVVLVISRIHHRLLHLGLTHQEAWMSLTRLRDTTISDIYSLAASLENVSTLTSRANSTKTMTSFQCDTAPYGKRQAQNPALATSQTPANDLIPGSQSRAALLKRLSHSRHFSRHAVSEASPAAANEPAWLGQLINGLSRSDEQTSSLVCQAIRRLIGCGLQLDQSAVSRIHVVGIAGPPSDKSAVLDGLVLACDPEIASLLSDQRRHGTLILNCDLTPDFIHQGQRSFYRHMTTHSLTSSSFTESGDWFHLVQCILYELGVTCVFVRGRCHTVIRSALLSRGVAVIENISIQALRCLASITQSTIINDVTDANTSHISHPVIERSSLYTDISNSRKMHPETFLATVRPCETDSESERQLTIQTIVTCSPVISQAEIMNERIRHVLSRLKMAVKDNKILPSFYTSSLVNLLSSTHSDVPFTDVFIEELSALKTDGQTFSVNDFGSTLAAWKMAWSVSRLLLNTNKCVVTGS